jgi:hypothetical protein
MMCKKECKVFINFLFFVGFCRFVFYNLVVVRNNKEKEIIMIAEILKKYAVIMCVVLILVMVYLSSVRSPIDVFYFLIMLLGVYVFAKDIDIDV